MAAAVPPLIARALFYNTHGTFVFIFVFIFTTWKVKPIAVVFTTMDGRGG
jgi:hypothetical protein